MIRECRIGRVGLSFLTWFLIAPEIVAGTMDPLAGWQFNNEAAMRYLGFKVYAIRLWRPNETCRPAEPFALELTYAMHFKGRDIVERSLDEMRQQGVHGARLDRWRVAMSAIFPDVKPGDRLLGVAVPGQEARFYAGDRYLGVVQDAEFVAAFFDIWLSAKTSAPRVRERLLATCSP
jgi:Chalcone isomerase-like